DTLRHAWHEAGGGELNWVVPQRAGRSRPEVAGHLSPEVPEVLARTAGGPVSPGNRRASILTLPVLGRDGVEGYLVGQAPARHRQTLEPILRLGAATIMDWLQTEQELAAMTSELADTYDQLVFVY